MAKDLQSRVQRAAQGGNTAVVQRQAPQGPEQAIKSMESQFALAMPRGAEAAQLVRDGITVMRQNPALANCDPQSVLGALMTCAQLGLRPGVGALGHAYIIPFKGKANFILGYQGMLELANRSGEIDLVVARTVYENDEFLLDYGSDQLIHRPAMNGRGPAIGYYAKFKRKGSDQATFEFMSVADAQEHRDKFALQKDRQGNIKGPWRDHFDAMALKTVVRKLFKWMPRSTQIQQAIIADDTVRYDTTPIGVDMNDVVEMPEQGTDDYDNVDQNTGEMPAAPEDAAAGYGPSEEDLRVIREQEMADQ